MGGVPRWMPEVYALGSPITHVTADDPPLLLVHGELDTIVDPNQSEIMHQAYQRAGLESTYIKVALARHSFVSPFRMSPSPAAIQQMVIDFFKKHLLTAE